MNVHVDVSINVGVDVEGKVNIRANAAMTVVQTVTYDCRGEQKEKDLLVQGLALLAGTLQADLQLVDLLLHAGKGAAVLRDEAAHLQCRLLCNAATLLHLPLRLSAISMPSKCKVELQLPSQHDRPLPLLLIEGTLYACQPASICTQAHYQPCR